MAAHNLWKWKDRVGLPHITISSVYDEYRPVCFESAEELEQLIKDLKEARGWLEQ